MHKYLKAIGFTELKKKQEIREILRQTADEFDSQQAVSLDETSEFYELKKQYGDSVGISVYGEMDQDKIFEREYYVPYFEEMVDFETFSKSDFRAVKVKECVAVPKSKKLLA